jgi:hypothetical protein
VIPSRYVVDVRNGSNADGLGSQVMMVLRGQGFLRGTVDTTGRADESVVYYTAADEDAAEQLAAHLGGIATAEVDEGVSPGHLQVVLGGDFDRTLAPAPSTTTPPPPPPLTVPITAGGVPCVN